MAFPAALTNAVDNITEIVAAHLNNLEAKVGIDGSAVVTSLDYLLKNPASIEPGHKHSKLWASDGSPEAVTVDAAGKVGIGKTNPGELLDVAGVVRSYVNNSNDLGSLYSRADVSLCGFFAHGSAFPGTLAGLNRASMVIWEAQSASSLVISTVNSESIPIIFAPSRTERMRLTDGGRLAIGTTSPNAAALLHLGSTDKGFLPPVMSTAQKNAIGTPPAGLVVYDSGLNKLCVYTGAAWESVSSA